MKPGTIYQVYSDSITLTIVGVATEVEGDYVKGFEMFISPHRVNGFVQFHSATRRVRDCTPLTAAVEEVA